MPTLIHFPLHRRMTGKVLDGRKLAVYMGGRKIAERGLNQKITTYDWYVPEGSGIAGLLIDEANRYFEAKIRKSV